jgi:hypothetical protein
LHRYRLTRLPARQEITMTNVANMSFGRLPDVGRDHVREASSPAVNAYVDAEIERVIARYMTASNEDISARIDELEAEWDVERYLEATAASVGIAGLLGAVFHDRRWMIVPGIVLPLLLQHAVQGWCPPLAAFRRIGVRTRKEIELERYALRVLRGDF